MKKFLALLILILLAPLPSDGADVKGGVTGLSLPRYASLKSGQVNMRKGPGMRYPIEWVYTRVGMPVEIIAEYDVWRQIRDSQGTTGWVHQTALSGRRMAIIMEKRVTLYRDDNMDSGAGAYLEKNTIGQIISCRMEWCKLKFSGTKGYLHKRDFWGALPNDVFN